MHKLDKIKPKSFFDQFSDSRIFEFVREDYKFIIVGYPHWRAFIISFDEKFRIEVYPIIDLNNRTIEIPEKEDVNKKKSLTDTNENLFDRGLSAKDVKTQADFFDHIPKEIAEYAVIYRDSHWEMLKALTYFGDNFRTLLKNNPALGYLIVNLENLNPSYSFYNHLAYIEHLITDKQKEILARAGFPAYERLVKVFSKIEPQQLVIKHLKDLRDSLLNSSPNAKERILKTLSHSKSINTKLLEIVSASKGIIEFLSNKGLDELINSDNYVYYIKEIEKIIVRSKKWKIEIPQIDKLSQIKSISEKIKDKILVLKKGSEFPPPPLPDNEYIIALKSPSEMRYWAIRQRNCIRNIIEEVKHGRCYFYKVVYNGEEATLKIKTGRTGIKMGDLLGKSNRNVSESMRVFVSDWFVKNTK